MTPFDKQSQRIMELELQLMHLQKDFEAIDETVLKNSRRIDELFGLVKRMSEKIGSGPGDLEERNLEDEKPPHY